MYKKIISLIVPVYNIEQYLPRCIESLLSCKKNYEIILIDDGSSDNSGAICEQYALKYQFISVYHKINGGVSSARNLGLEKAEGKYIYFIDGDDWVDNIDTLIECVEHSNCPCICVNYTEINEEGKVNKERKYCFTPINTSLFIKLKDIHFHALWGIVLSKELIDREKIRLDEDLKYAEDWLFYVKFLALCPQITSCEKFSYQYRVDRQGSAMNTKYTVQDIWTYFNVYDRMKSSQYIQENRGIILYESENCFSYILNTICKNIAILDKKKIQSAIRKRITYKLITNSSTKNAIKFLIAFFDVALLNKIKHLHK